MPWVILAVLITHSATLPGSLKGVKAYIGNWDMEKLQGREAWSDAAGQVFFTLGATLGTVPEQRAIL